MNSASITYALLWRIKFANEYQFTKCGKCFNTKRGKLVKKLYVSRCIGYKINGKFYSLTKLRTQLERIPKQECPF